MQDRLKKSRREPERVQTRQLTKRALDIIATIARYRFLPTSLIVRVVDGNHRITEDHLQKLYHKGLVNRFQLKRNGECNYYLDNPDALRLLDPAAVDMRMFKLVRNYREKDYAGAAQRLEPGKLMFLEHELMVSRFHWMLELACRQSAGAVVLGKWVQGSAIEHRVHAPEVRYNPARDEWLELDQTESLPHEPDAFFILRFPEEPEGRNQANFFYEADRDTMTDPTDMKRKLRAHFHFIVKQHRHEELYGIRRVRAVLFEATRTRRADNLREQARHPVVSGRNPSALFWFTTAELYTKTEEVEEDGKAVQRPLFLLHPELIFKQIWASPVEDKLLSMVD